MLALIGLAAALVLVRTRDLWQPAEPDASARTAMYRRRRASPPARRPRRGGRLRGRRAAQDRYSLAGGCYALRSVATGKFVARAADGGYRASAGGAGGAEPFRIQATALGRYLLYGAKRDFVGVGPPTPLPVATPTNPLPVPGLPGSTTTRQGDRVQSVGAPSETADWRVNGAGDAFAIDLPAAGGQVLTVAGDGTIIMRDRAAAGERGRWTFVSRAGCPELRVTCCAAGACARWR